MNGPQNLSQHQQSGDVAADQRRRAGELAAQDGHMVRGSQCMIGQVSIHSNGMCNWWMSRYGMLP